MFTPSNRLQNSPEYVFARLAREVEEVEKNSGRKVLNFGQGSPDIAPSKIYLDKLSDYIREPKSHLYPGYRGIPEFNNAVVKFYKKRFGVAISESEVFPLLGAKDGVAHLPLTLADVGDTVLVPNPGYPGFSGPAELFGVNVKYYDIREENDFKLTIKDLEKVIDEKTKYIWINFPSNPTGATITLSELAEIVDFLREKNITIIYDNAYSEIYYGETKPPSILELESARDCAIEIGSFSKTFSFAGMRMGYAVGSKKIIDALAKTKSQMDSGMWIPLQKMGAYALTNIDQNWYANTIKEYKRRRDIIARKLTYLGLKFKIPEAALYIWAKIPDSEKNSEAFSMRILREKQILLTPGSAFGTNGNRFVRVSVCADLSKIDKHF